MIYINRSSPFSTTTAAAETPPRQEDVMMMVVIIRFSIVPLLLSGYPIHSLAELGMGLLLPCQTPTSQPPPFCLITRNRRCFFLLSFPVHITNISERKKERQKREICIWLLPFFFFFYFFTVTHYTSFHISLRFLPIKTERVASRVSSFFFFTFIQDTYLILCCLTYFFYLPTLLLTYLPVSKYFSPHFFFYPYTCFSSSF